MVTGTKTTQDYLKAIFQLGRGRVPVNTSELAERLEVAPASVSTMLRRLDGHGLVEHTPYQGVRLTERGAREAVELIRHHRLLEVFLVEKVGLSWDEVHDEAEVLEHALSEDLEARLDELLGHPTHDPHGHVIPGPDLSYEETERPTLAGVGTGSCVVRHVSDHDPELLRYLDGLGLRPGTSVDVLEVVPYGGGIRVRVDAAEQVVGTEAAEAIFVSMKEDACEDS